MITQGYQLGQGHTQDADHDDVGHTQDADHDDVADHDKVYRP